MFKTQWTVARPDDPFFFTVYAAARQEEVASWGWGETEQLEFLIMQYHCQQRSYHLQYPQLESRIILSGSSPAGRVLLAKTEEGYVLVDISLLLEYRNQGIGSALLKEIQAEIRPGESLRLSVYKANPAQQLYRLLGFKEYADNELFLTLEWRNELVS